MMIVLSILAALLTIVLPRYGTHNRAIRLTTTVDQYLAIVELAKSSANSLNRDVTMEFNISENVMSGITITDEKTNPPTDIDTYTFEFGIKATPNVMVKSVVFRSKKPLLIKDHTGNPKDSDDFTMIFSDSEGVTRNVILYTETGTTLIQKK